MHRLFKKDSTKSKSSFLELYEVFLEKAIAPHSSTLAWKIPWTEEPGSLQATGSLRVGHNRVTSLSFFTFMHWRRKWQPTPVFLPGESQGQGSLVGCHLRDHTESDSTEGLSSSSSSMKLFQEKISIIFFLKNKQFVLAFSNFKITYKSKFPLH